MMLNRLKVLAVVVLLWPALGMAADTVKMNENGLHIQEWFHNGELNLAADLRAAAALGKNLMVLVEQRGCTYCAKLHATNFARPDIIDLLDENFLVVQLDLNGSRNATGFDGARVSEARLLAKWGVTTTPTTVVFAGDNAAALSLKEAETFRLPGYLEPLQYYLALDYFVSGEYQVQNFSDFMNVRVVEMTKAGLDPQSW